MMMDDPREQAPKREHGSASPWNTGSQLVVRPWMLVLGAAVLLAAAVVGFNLLTSDGGSDRASTDSTPGGTVGTTVSPAESDDESPREPVQAPRAADGYRPPAWTLIATPDDDIDSYRRPGGEATGVVPARWNRRVSALPVIDERKGWLQVRLPQRPNGSTAWVRRGDVKLSSTPYRIRIDVATTRLRLYERGELALDAPAGIGTADAPTTPGEFFVTFLQEPPDDGGNWGPFVMVTSSHSETISDWQESGDAIAAIHGPLGSTKAIGNTGAKVSHGCIRLHVEDLAALRDVPAGSPIDVIDSSQTGART